MSASIPQVVLGDELRRIIAGRTVRAAVFTTFTFDPGFFELHILPSLFDYPFHQAEKVRRVQLEDLLRGADVAVYYDRSGLSQDALPAQLDFQRIDVRRVGFFHPKIVLVLLDSTIDEESDDSDDGNTKLGVDRNPMSLIVGTLSANLTRSGWWENVETGHFAEIEDVGLSDQPCSYRADLLALIRRLRQDAREEDHRALDRIHEFLRHHTSRAVVSRNRSNHRWHTRLFFGQSALPTWLVEVGLGRGEWNIEIISPYFDGTDAVALQNVVEALNPRETRVHLPYGADGEALVALDLYESVASIATWSMLPSAVLDGGRRAGSEKVVQRRVHAKVYRLWRRDAEVVLTGSPNLTRAGHSRAAAGNLEAAFLVDRGDAPGRRTWWMTPLTVAPERFHDETPSEAEESQPMPIDVSLRYHWDTGQLFYRLDSDQAIPFEVCEAAGRRLLTVVAPVTREWTDCGEVAAAQLRQLLLSTSFLLIRQGDNSWRVLVREEGTHQRPSVRSTLTPEEILMYWSLLTPTQQAAFIEEMMGADSTLEGLPVRPGERYTTANTVFDRFAGLFHAFEQLRERIGGDIDEGQARRARALLFGAKYDSVPELLRKVRDRDASDPVMSYVTFLCAQQLRDQIHAHYPEFWNEHVADARELDALLMHRGGLRANLPIDDGEREKFLDWYEDWFLTHIEQPVEAPPRDAP